MSDIYDSQPRENAPQRGDDRVWPLNCVILILALCAGGLIISRGNFGANGIVESAKLLAANGWVQLLALVFAVAVLMMSAIRARNETSVRRMQFSACLGLLVHLGMLTGLHYANPIVAARVSAKDHPPRRPFKIVSLPSDGKQLTKRILEQGLSRPVETDHHDEQGTFERLAQPELQNPIRELQEGMPLVEPESKPSEIVPADLARTDTSAARMGQPSAAQLQRQLAEGPIPPAENVAEPEPSRAPLTEPQTDAPVSSRRQQPVLGVAPENAVGLSPDLGPLPRADVLAPSASPRPMDERGLAGNARAPSPARESVSISGFSDFAAPQVTEPTGAATASRPNSETLEPAATAGRNRTAPSALPEGGRGGTPLESGIVRPSGGQAPRVQLSQRIPRDGLPGSGTGPRAVATPFAQRGQIVVEGGPAGEDGVPAENELAGTGSAGRANGPGDPGPEVSVQPRLPRTATSLPGLVGRGGPGDGTGPGAGSGSGAGGIGGGAGAVIGAPRLGAAAGSSPPAGALSPVPGLGRGTLGSAVLPGNADGEGGGAVAEVPSGQGAVAGGSSGIGNAGTGKLRDGPQETVGSSFGARRPAALPGPRTDPVEPGIGIGGADSPVTTGIPSRRARPLSESLSGGTGRFILDKSTTGPSLDTRADPAPAFRQRGRAGRGKIAESLGGNMQSERAVELGLVFLAQQQSRDGHWSLHDFAAGRPGFERAGEGSMQADTAATGLVLLAFLGAGYSHLDDPHRSHVEAGINYLVRNQKPNGDLFQGGSDNVWFYSHGIAAIALCEAYGMTRDPRLREPAQKCLDFIIAAQHPTLGGWRYSPRVESDTSVSGWQMMALKSGELAGLRVSPSTYAGVSTWLNSAQSRSDPSKYSYLPGSPHSHQRLPSRAMTAEALLMRLYLGWDRANPNLVRGADFLRQNLPQIAWADGPSRETLRDTYYWYYATQVMFQMQGDYWESWNNQLRPLLVDSQVQDGPLAGSWEPQGAIPDRWGTAGGRLYVTAMHLLMLEVYYRHLPLYQTLAGSE